MGEQIEVLEHHAHFAPNFRDVLQVIGQFDTIDDDVALLMFFQAIDAANHGGLAGTRWAANDNSLALVHR